jgi:kynurenine formamidase
MSGVIIDLTMPIRDGVDGVKATLQQDPPEYVGHACYAWDLEIPSHTGTYFETSAHVFRDGISTEQFPVEQLFLPGRCFRINDSRRLIDAEDLHDASESLSHGLPDVDWALLVDVGDRDQSEHAYFSQNAALWMVENRVRIMGSNTPRYDIGFDSPTGFFVELFAKDVAIVANVKRLELLPVAGFSLLVMPLAVDGVCTVPCRALAFLD